MLYHDDEQSGEASAAHTVDATSAPTAALSAGATAPTATAATYVADSLSPPAKVVVAKPVTAHGEPVLVGKVVSAEPSAVRGHAVAAQPVGSGAADVQQQQTNALLAKAAAALRRATANGGHNPAEAAASAANNHHEDDDGDAVSSPVSATSSSSSSAASSTSFVGDVDKTELIFDFGRYVGSVDPLTGLRDGEGCLHYKSGNVYTGSWRDGAADGFGEKRYKNGDVYRGHWREGKRSGRGAYLFAQGHFYDGMYANDQPDGYGIYTTLKGDRYAGNWKAGHKNGKGRETLVNGQVFVGNWRNGKKQGRGKLYLPGAEGYIYGIWNNDHFFRELTEQEMGGDGKEDVVDEFGLPRDANAPPVTPPWMKPAPLGAAVTDRVLMGVTALEDRMESLGKALERVMGTSSADGADGGPPPSASAGGLTRGTNTTATAAAAARSAAPHLLFASPNRPTAEGILASDLEDDDGEGDDDERPTVGVELRRPQRQWAAGSARDSTPPAAVLSTAGMVEEAKESEGEGRTVEAAAVAREEREAGVSGQREE